MMDTLLVDSHCHLDFPDFKGREGELLGAMKANGVGWALVAGCDAGALSRLYWRSLSVFRTCFARPLASIPTLRRRAKNPTRTA
jgi:Tat protein secretion system quality control protein TatD with DNase activity